MVFDIPFPVLALFIGVSITLFVLSFMIQRPKYLPFFAMIAGILWISVFALADNITMGYTAERDILTHTLFLQGNPASSSTTTHMNVTTSDSFRGLDTSGTKFAGEEVTASSSLVGDTFNRVSVHIYKLGSPTGNAILAVYDSTVAPTNVNYLTLIATIDSATLTTTPTLYTYNFAGHTLASNQAIGIFYNGGSGANQVRWSLNTANPFDGTNSRETQYTSSFTDNTTFDLRMALSNVVSVTAEDTEEINSHDTKGNTPINWSLGAEDNANWYVRVYFSLFGLAFIALSVLQAVDNRRN